MSPKKCEIFKDEVAFLGLLAGKKIRVDLEKTEVIKNWPKPENLTELRGFLGLIQFFKIFVKSSSEMAR